MFIYGCSESDENALLNTENVQTKTEEVYSKEKIEQQRELVTNSLMELYGITDRKSLDSDSSSPVVYKDDKTGEIMMKNISENQILEAIKSAFPQRTPTIHGPFYASAVSSKVRTNVRILWYSDDGTNYPPIGNYWSDIILYNGSFTTPPNAIAGYMEENVPPHGWGYKEGTDINVFKESFRGYSYHQVDASNNRITMSGRTYSLIINYNTLGQSVEIHKPFHRNSANITYKFYYITL